MKLYGASLFHMLCKFTHSEALVKKQAPFGVSDDMSRTYTSFLLDNLRNRSRIGINKWYQSFALRNFDLEDMEFESANSNTTIKLPKLKLAQENGTLVTKMYVPVTAEEKTNKKNDVKAISLLLMALPNEHQLTFSQYPDAKIMFATIKTRFGGNEATKKTQKTLLKQQYENFSATSAKSLDSIFNRLQKIVTCPPEWNTHVVVWMNKPEVDTMSIDDLYNNFKIVEQKVKKSGCASSGAQNLAFMIAPSTSSTNDANTASPKVSTASPNVNTTSPQVSTASFSDNVVYTFMVENPNGSNLLHQDLEQIHEDDLEAMDLKWQLSLLSMRAKRYDTLPGSVEHQEARKAFDWSDMADEQVQIKIALIAFLDSEVYNDKTCSKTCLKNFETLKKQCDDLIVKLNQTKFTATTYKRGLATLEEQLITYRKNEVLFSEVVAVLNREVACKDYEIKVLKSEFEKVKQEKEGIEFKIEKFDKASKDLDQLLGSQITNKSKKGLAYSAVPPPHPLIYNRPKKLDLSYSGLDEFKEPEFKGYGPENSKQESNIVCNKKLDDFKENSNNSLVKEQVSKDTSSFVESLLNVDKETIFPVDKKDKPQQDDTGLVDSGCSRHMTGNIAYLSNFKEFDRGYVTFGGGTHGGRISSKGTLKIDSLDFEDVYFVIELKFNLFSVSQMCDKKNYVFFTDTGCLVLSPNFKLPDESLILLKIPRKDNIYSFDTKNIVPVGSFKGDDEQDKSDDVSSPKEVNVVGQHVNTASPDVNNGESTCRKNFCNSNFNRFGYLWICLVERGPLEQISNKIVFSLSFMGFLVYQMDVKSTFLYGTIEEEVYVTQPPRFKEPDHPDKVYKVVKALYGLHQAPRAWYETLANYLLGNGFKRGKIDQTLFIKKQKGDILLVQVYVDDIIFGSTNKELCTGFEKLMKDKF
ncbi:putative ribonuclease H-like domain-containing protein [Tanacetum coccineum]